MERFDSTLAKYSQKHAIEQEEKQREPTLRDIWQKYQRANAKRVAKTTQKGFWKTTTLAIARLSAVGGSGGLEHPDRLLAGNYLRNSSPVGQEPHSSRMRSKRSSKHLSHKSTEPTATTSGFLP
ncbi:MAG: hypothetical protein MUE44_21385 [Oscillatoriaceae cyanobacterium Prado104]|nr:hypothetical protein [Oscillatoriaceae cyanobacterium Prado104]